MAALGYALQRCLLNRTLGGDLLPPLLVTFGLSIILQNGLLEVFTADSRRLQAGALETASLELAAGLAIGRHAAAGVRRGGRCIGGLQWIFYRTALGRALRATSDDRRDRRADGHRPAPHLRARHGARRWRWSRSPASSSAIRTNFDPAIGPARLLFAFEAVIIGGLGSLWGTLAGGVILGVAQAIGAQIDPGWQLLAGHLAFLALLVVRPHGLFPRMR